MNDRPVLEKSEIDVTPEMIEAGERAYYTTDAALVGEDGLVVSIFRAMMSEYHNSRCKSLYKHKKESGDPDKPDRQS